MAMRTKRATEPADNFPIPLAMAAKIGSALVHFEEFFSPGGHASDMQAGRALLGDAEVKAFLGALDAKALLPKRRGTVRR